MKKALKRWLSLFLAITIIIGSAYAGINELDADSFFIVKAEASSTESLTFTLSADGTYYTVTDCDYSSVNVTIPATYNGKPVTGIGDFAFQYCDNLVSVVVPDSVTSIGDSAFYCCGNLASINIPDGVMSIGEGAFSYCYSLLSITIPDGVTEIAPSLFYDCSSLTEVELGEGVTSIGDSAFSFCYNLLSVTIPTGVTNIGAEAFCDCDSLTTVTIPDSVTNIDDYAFGDCDSLTSITLPHSVTSIGEGAFGSCSAITAITVDSDNKNYNSVDGVLFDKNQTLLIQYPAGSTATSYIVPDSVIGIGDSAFGGCENLISITLQDGLSSIGNGAFSRCTNLTFIDIPDSVTSIGESAFSDCDSLVSVSLPDGLTGIGSRTFSWCSSLTSVNIPDSVTSIGASAFYECISLTDITLPDSVTSIEYSAFSECSSLTEIIIPDGVKGISGSAFYNCDSLNRVTIPNGVTSIGFSAFYGCDSLSTITIPDSVNSIERYAFAECTSLTDIVIPEGVQTISGSTFYNCGKLKSITIPRSVTSVGEWAFLNCTSLAHIYYGGTEADWKRVYIASDNNLLTNATIHYHQHTYDSEWSVTIEPTCTESGSKRNTCSVCGDVVIEEIPVIDHEYSSEWIVDVEPTYTTNGVKSHHCLYCGRKKDLTVIPKLPNNESVYVTDSEMLCNGEITYTVKIKGGVGVQSSAIGVSFDPNVIELVPEKSGPCTTDSGSVNVNGIYAQGASVGSDNLYVIGHINTTKQVFTNDTDYVKFTFKVKDYSLSEINVNFYCGELIGDKAIAKNNYEMAIGRFVVQVVSVSHTISDEWRTGKPATADESGLLVRNCISCGDVLESQIIPQILCDKPVITSAEQGLDDITVTWSPVFGADGYSVYRKADSDWSLIGQVDGGCTEFVDTVLSDNTVYSYKICADNEVGSSEFSDVASLSYHVHVMGDWFISLEPTCTEEGYRSQTCSRCGAVFTEAIISNGHSYSTEWTIDIEATCTEPGSKSHHCIACGDITDETEISPVGHYYTVIGAENEHPHITTYECELCEHTKAEYSIASDCPECNFTVTELDSDRCVISSYIGTEAEVMVPAIYNGMQVVGIADECFKNASFVTSIKIGEGVTSIGDFAFKNCKALKAVYIPRSVTAIDVQTFYGFTGAIYCYKDTFAHEYAVANNIRYVLMSIVGTDDTRIDYDEYVIYSSLECCDDINELFTTSETAVVFVDASHMYGDAEFYGTGTLVTVFDGDEYIGDYTLVIYGDVNGDSVCDALDAAQVANASNGLKALEVAYAMAADINFDDEITIADYQAIVNKVVA